MKPILVIKAPPEATLLYKDENKSKLKELEEKAGCTIMIVEDPYDSTITIELLSVPSNKDLFKFWEYLIDSGHVTGEKPNCDTKYDVIAAFFNCQGVKMALQS